MTSFQPVRGTKDLLFEEKLKQQTVIDRSLAATQSFGCSEIETPIFESTNVFHRLGETSDVVSKETYTFDDRGGDSLTLRPEGTASVVRALISNGLTQSMPAKFFYSGPMFRYDRPQKGRYRQFTQIGAELFGISSFHGDVEAIQMAEACFQAIGIRHKIALQLNTLGDQDSRDIYRDKLVTYFSQYKNDLSEDSLRRLDKNPLRILDSKDEGDKKLVAGAPCYNDSLTNSAKEFFDHVQNALTALGIDFERNTKLVRGLDYYCHTTFEYVTKELGSQGTVLAGGRYDGLVHEMGGPEVSGVGWAGGVERLALLMDEEFSLQRPIVVLPMGEAAELKAFTIAAELRKAGECVETLYTGNLGKRLKKATRMKASVALILGDDELAAGQVQVRLLDKGHEEKIAIEQLVSYIQSN